MTLQPESDGDGMLLIECSDRWQVYFRLQELGLDCQCQSYKPLLVKINSAHDAVQVWSVVNQVSKSKQDLMSWIKQCWQLPTYSV